MSKHAQMNCFHGYGKIENEYRSIFSAYIEKNIFVFNFPVVFVGIQCFPKKYVFPLCIEYSGIIRDYFDDLKRANVYSLTRT